MTTETRIFLKIEHTKKPTCFVFETDHDLYDYAKQAFDFHYFEIWPDGFDDIFYKGWQSDKDLANLAAVSNNGQQAVVEIHSRSIETTWHEVQDAPNEFDAVVEAIASDGYATRIFTLDESVDFISEYKGHDWERATLAVKQQLARV